MKCFHTKFIILWSNYKYQLEVKLIIWYIKFSRSFDFFRTWLKFASGYYKIFRLFSIMIAWKRFHSLETDLLQHFSTFRHRKRLNQSIRFLLLNQFHSRLKFLLWLVFHFQFPNLLHRTLVALWWTKMESELFWFAEQIKFQTEMMSQFYSSLLTQPIRNLLKILFLTPKFLNPIGKFKYH